MNVGYRKLERLLLVNDRMDACHGHCGIGDTDYRGDYIAVTCIVTMTLRKIGSIEIPITRPDSI